MADDKKSKSDSSSRKDVDGIVKGFQGFLKGLGKILLTVVILVIISTVFGRMASNQYTTVQLKDEVLRCSKERILLTTEWISCSIDSRNVRKVDYNMLELGVVGECMFNNDGISYPFQRGAVNNFPEQAGLHTMSFRVKPGQLVVTSLMYLEICRKQ